MEEPEEELHNSDDSRKVKLLVQALELCASNAPPNEATWIRHVLDLIIKD